jgi:hypothetical protein
MSFSSNRPSAHGGRVRHLFATLALVLASGASAQSRENLEMEVAWTDERCDFIVTRNDAGHGVVMRLTPLALKIGDVLVGPLNEVGFGRKIAKQGTDEAAMMQIRKYGMRRKPALDLVYEWSRHCNPPEE